MQPIPLTTDPRAVGGLAALILAGVLALASSASVRAQADDQAAEFRDAVAEARAETQATITEAIAAVDDGCVGIEIPDCLTEVVAVQLPVVVAEYTAYADRLESLSAPDALTDDVAMHVELLRSASLLLDEVVRAAASDDVSSIPDLTDEIAAAHADLAERLDPAYGREAFVSPFVGLPNTPFQHIDFLVLMGATETEEAYLDAVRDTTQLLAQREGCFQGAFMASLDPTVDLLGRLVSCGAGSTYDDMLEQARILEPPPRFADEHAWWLATLEASAQHDRTSSEAAQAGDVPGFIADMLRIGLATRPYEGLDPTFGSASQLPGSRLGSAPDLDAPVSRSDYGEGLFGALVAYWVVDPRYHAMLPMEFPGLPEDVALAAAAEASSDLLAAEGDLRTALAGLEPPPEFAADHALMLDFFERARERLEAYLQAAEAGDLSAAQAAMEGGFADYCGTVDGLSDEIRPVTDVFFAGLGC